MEALKKRAPVRAGLALAGVLVVGAALLGAVASAHEGQHDMHSGMDMASGTMNMSHKAAAPASSSASSLSVTGCWIRALPAPVPSAGYFVIHNNGTQEVRLTGASSPAFGVVMLHQSIENDGMSEMKMAHNVPVPAGGVLAFKPGSYHAMLEKPTDKLVIGSHLELDLSFDSGAGVKASCEVKPPSTLAN